VRERRGPHDCRRRSADVDDAAGAVAWNEGEECARDAKRAEDLVIEVRNPVGIGPQNLAVHPPHRSAGVVDDDVNRTERVFGRRGARVDLIGLGDVGAERQHFHASVLPDARGGLLELLFSSREQHEVHTLSGEAARDRASNAFAAAGDRRCPSFEPEFHRHDAPLLR
jgi:hypothetical protein